MKIEGDPLNTQNTDPCKEEKVVVLACLYSRKPRGRKRLSLLVNQAQRRIGPSRLAVGMLRTEGIVRE